MSEHEIAVEPPTEDTDDLPWLLAKALSDQAFQYLVMLRNGVIVECTGANRDKNRDWITLTDPVVIHPKLIATPDSVGFNFERGFCVRVSDIVGAVDAPHGS
jgi:hypothetical protein